MTTSSSADTPVSSNPPVLAAPVKLLGVPVGDFGLFASTLIAVALGFMTFFGVTFLSIFGLVIYNAAGGHAVTLDTSYKFIALPAGIVVLVVSFTVLMGLWVRRKLTGG
jgi:hypothetical protein